MSMELKACREALKSGNKPAADDLLCVKAFSMEQVKAIEEKDGRIICDFILSNGAVDRDFDTVNPDDMWNLPVAKSLLEKVEDGELIGRAEFTSKDENDYGYMVGQMYKLGFLHAVSCRFRGIEWKWTEDVNRPYGIDFVKQELLEYSCVTIPANPDALLKAKAAGVDVSPAVQMAENVLSKNSFDALAKSIAERVYAAVSKKMTVVDLHDDRLAQEKMKAMQMRLNLNKNKGGLN